MHINDLTPELEEALEVKFVKREPKIRKSGEKWTVVDVLIHDVVMIGSITFRDDEYFHHNLQKSAERRDVCLIDEKFYRFERYMLDGFIIPLAMCSPLLGYAKTIAAHDIMMKRKWRKENPNPNKNRKPLIGKNPRYILRALILNISDNKDEFRTSIKTIINDHFHMKELSRRL